MSDAAGGSSVTDDDLHRVLDEDGRVVAGATVPDLDDETLVGMYRDMLLTRHFDTRTVNIQRQGRLGTFAAAAGQEGAQIGSTYALAPDDWIHYQYREHGVLAVRGLDAGYLRYWMGHEAGNAAVAERNVFPLNITIGDHIPHAVGMAWAMKLRGDDDCVLVHFGDGATSEGDFHEACNFAGVFDVACVFLCNNNGWAISHPAEEQTAAATFAQKADAYGFDGVRVDGMDPLAVYDVVSEAAARAKADDPDGPRPTLVEAVMYRFGAHTTADDPTVYRDEAEVEAWRERDPLTRFEAFLRDRGLLDDERKADIEADVEDTVAGIIEAAESHDPDPAELFDYAFADPTPEIRRQRAAFERLLDDGGDEAFLREH
jgi:pyruvate dehydrogenase E1 component alpha subunit